MGRTTANSGQSEDRPVAEQAEPAQGAVPQPPEVVEAGAPALEVPVAEAVPAADVAATPAVEGAPERPADPLVAASGKYDYLKDRAVQAKSASLPPAKDAAPVS